MSYNLYEPGLYEPHKEQIDKEGVSYSDHTDLYNDARIKMAYQDGYKKGYEDGKNFYSGTLGGQ